MRGHWRLHEDVGPGVDEEVRSNGSTDSGDARRLIPERIEPVGPDDLG